MVLAGSDRVPRAPPYSGYCYTSNTLRLQGCHLLRPAFPKPLGFCVKCNIAALLPPDSRNCQNLGFFPFARRYSENHFCFLFLRVLRCFSSPGLPPPDFSGGYHDHSRWVAPFGYLRINSYLPIPAVFRSLSRPSSPPGAKASPVRPL